MNNEFRHNLLFDPLDKKQKMTSKFLNKLPRSQSRFISDIVYKFLNEHGIVNVEELSNSDAKKLAFELKETVSSTSSTTSIGLSLNDVATLLSAMQIQQQKFSVQNETTNQESLFHAIHNNGTSKSAAAKTSTTPSLSHESATMEPPTMPAAILTPELGEDDDSEDENMDIANKLLANSSLFMQ